MSLTACNNKYMNLVLKLAPIPVEFIQISFNSENKKNNVEYSTSSTLPFASSTLYSATVKSARCLTDGDNVKRVIEIEFNRIENLDFQYEPGSTIGVLPQNDQKEVIFLIERLNLGSVADTLFTATSIIKNKQIPDHIIGEHTIRQVITNNLHLRSIPKKALLRCLSRYATLPSEARRLEELCSVQGTDDYRTYVVEKHTTLLDILKQFPSCLPPFSRLIEHVPRLLPRPYSISSSPLQPNIKITLSVIRTKTGTEGVCSGWLNSLCEPRPTKNTLEAQMANLNLLENQVPIYFRKPTQFRLPTDNTIPLIMIGPGTGIAPFIGFLRHRHQMTLRSPQIKFGKTWLFFGCRYDDQDFLYKTELRQFSECGLLTKLSTSFSREGSTIKYVQDNVRLHSKEVVNWIVSQNATVFVCGDGRNMAKSVKLEITRCLQQADGGSNGDAENKIKEMVTNARYVEDIWM